MEPDSAVMAPASKAMGEPRPKRARTDPPIPARVVLSQEIAPYLQNEWLSQQVFGPSFYHTECLSISVQRSAFDDPDLSTTLVSVVAAVVVFDVAADVVVGGYVFAGISHLAR